MAMALVTQHITTHGNEDKVDTLLDTEGGILTVRTVATRRSTSVIKVSGRVVILITNSTKSNKHYPLCGHLYGLFTANSVASRRPLYQ